MITFSMIVVWIVYLVLLYLIVFWILVFLENQIVEKEEKIEKFPLVSIVIPAYNEEKNITDTLKSVINLDYPKNKLEIIVVNDGSKDNTEKIVKNFINEHQNYNIKVYTQKNAGKGAALNKAIKISKGEFFTPFDADSVVKKDALKKIIPHFNNKDVAIVLPLMKVRNPKNFIEKLQWCEYLINLFYKRLMGILDCVSVAPGPFSVYRKKVLEEVGGFDINNLTEDLEVTLKIQRKNYKVVQLYSTEVYTKVPDNFKAFYKQRNRWYKGTMINAFNFKKMAFNKKYGDFGIIQMPRLLLEGVLVVASFSIILYSQVLNPLIQKINILSKIDFNFMFQIKQVISNFNFLDLEYANIFLGLAVLILAISLIVFAHKEAKEPLKKHGIISLISYMLLYGMIASIILVFVFVDLIRGKVQKW